MLKTFIETSFQSLNPAVDIVISRHFTLQMIKLPVMKKIPVILLALMLLSQLTQAQGIQFEKGSWSEVVAKAKAQNKPIFLDAYTTWCGPCKKMAKDVFTKSDIGEYFNTHFINYQMDMEKGEGIAFAKNYEVNAFPTLLYFDGNGNLTFKAVGAKDGTGLLEQAKMATDPAYQLKTYKEEYEQSDKTVADLKKYVDKLREGGSYKSASALVEQYLLAMTEKDKLDVAVFRLINGYIYDYKSSSFEFLLQHKKQYRSIAGKENVDRYIFNVLAIRSIPGTRGADSRQTYDGYLDSYSRYLPVEYFKARIRYFEFLNGNEDSLFKYARNLMDKDFEVDYPDDKLNYFRVFMANRYIGEGGEKLEAALLWAQKAAKADPGDYKPAYVYAQLLSEKNQYKAALEWAEKALVNRDKSGEAPVMQQLFKAETIEAFIKKVQQQLADRTD